MPTAFVYGTLCNPERARSVIGAPPEYLTEVRLSDLHRVDGRYPTLAPGGSVEGRLLQVDSFDRLDRYEGVDSGLYIRVSVPHEDGSPVWVYVGHPARLGVDVEWPGEGTFHERVTRYVERAGVEIRTR